VLLRVAHADADDEGYRGLVVFIERYAALAATGIVGTPRIVVIPCRPDSVICEEVTHGGDVVLVEGDVGDKGRSSIEVSIL
jgi:acyl-CoA hydrolase